MSNTMIAKAWDWLGDNQDSLKTIGTLVAGGAAAYNAYDAAKQNKQILDFQKNMYNRSIQKEDQAQQAFSSAVNNSFGKKEEDKQPQMQI